jgi:signal transduction histidine kinase
MWRGISLANKCLLLFGTAVILIIVAALSVPWVRMNSIVDEAQFDTSRQLVTEWQARIAEAGGPPPKTDTVAEGRISHLTVEEAGKREEDAWFIERALERFEQPPGPDGGRPTQYDEAWWDGTTRRYWHARALRTSDGAFTGILLLVRPSPAAARQIVVNTAYMLSAALIAGGVAILVFYLITDKIILGPVRTLKETAEQIREGELATRSSISTGDEFEELAETFNQMVEALATSQNQLRAINASLDLKLNELAERNVELYELARLKGEFLANVSHELRTPLNSILGFADLLIETAEREAAAGDDSSRLSKRRRYLENIVTASRSLLEMINGLLDMAKAEAGRMEIRIEPMNVKDACDGLMALMRPVADRAGVELLLEAADDLPTIETDTKKFQQILFNLLSNAIKFTGAAAGAEAATDQPASEGAPPSRPDGQLAPLAAPGSAVAVASGRPARVTLRAERLFGRAGEGPGAEDRVRVSVIDTGPGIAPEDRAVIFEKFRQLEGGHTRKHPGTGLGLAICKELTSLLQGEIHVDSELGRGSMFSIILPLRIDPERAAEMKLEMAFRGTLNSQRPPR